MKQRILAIRPGKVKEISPADACYREASAGQFEVVDETVYPSASQIIGELIVTQELGIASLVQRY